jgi:hypothetical protein
MRSNSTLRQSIAVTRGERGRAFWLAAVALAAIAVSVMLYPRGDTPPVFAATFTVDDTGDTPDAFPGDGICRDVGGRCTLRAAVMEANATAGVDLIDFNIGGGGPQGILAAGQPPITEGVRIDATTQPGFAGTPLIGIKGPGTFAGPPSVAAFYIRASGVTVRGFSVYNFPTGVYVETPASGGNSIVGNWFGVVGANSNAVLISRADADIGGSTAADRNVIANSARDGIFVSGTLGPMFIKGNYIGTDPSGAIAMPNGGAGVLVVGALPAPLTIGRDAAGDGNLIANNFGSGVGVRTFGAASIRGNQIDKNGGLGIDLNNDTVTANDPLDPDIGPNNLQNFPVLTAASSTGASTDVTGALNSEAVRTFDVDFYNSPSCDPSVYGEGATYLGSTSVTTDAFGDANFTVTLPVGSSVGSVVTATATDAGGNTSEFSQCVTVAVGVPTSTPTPEPPTDTPTPVPPTDTPEPPTDTPTPVPPTDTPEPPTDTPTPVPPTDTPEPPTDTPTPTATPFFPDTDGDGCTDFEEDVTSPGSELLGGLRDKLNRWDFYDVNGDKKIDTVDIGLVRSKWNPFGPVLPADEIYDRSVGAATWAPGPPDNRINAIDIAKIRASFNHDCQGLPN